MEKQIKKIEYESRLQTIFKPDIIPWTSNNYWILIEDCILEFNFKFPLLSNIIEIYEKTLIFPINSEEKNGIKFKNCRFTKNTQIYFDEFKGRDIYFELCTFESEVYLNSYDKNIKFSNCTFKNHFIAENSIISAKIRFRECHFINNVNFRNTTFEGLSDFWRSKFYKTTIFYKTNFLDTVVFSAAIFKENVLFTYTLINKLILFRGTIIEKGFDISVAIIYGKLGLFGFDLSDYTNFKYIIEEDEYEDAVGVEGIIPINNKRETFRILKDNLESNKNLAESLKFKAIEKEVLRKELIHSENWNSHSKFSINCKNIINNWFERFNLWLNKISNDHGNSYGSAFVFIVLVSLFFFYISLLNTQKYSFSSDFHKWDFGNGFKLYLEFLNPLHKFDYIEKNELTSAWFYAFDFIGKLLVSYGIYQFIQAFRKYK